MKRARSNGGVGHPPGPSGPSATWRDSTVAPLVGITTDVVDRSGVDTSQVSLAYARAVVAAGGTPVLLAPVENLVTEYVRRFGAFVLTGGDDPRTEPFGAPTHPRATPLHPVRQSFESVLIRALAEQRPETPVLGVCLGMQMLALHAGGTLDQHMPDSHPDAARHWNADHKVVPSGTAVPFAVPPGVVRSKHKQAVSEPGRMTVLASSDDGVIEAIADPERPFVLGVQWHPERTEHAPLGLDLFKRLVAAARS
jgi:putative glutamine amidotransferase